MIKISKCIYNLQLNIFFVIILSATYIRTLNVKSKTTWLPEARPPSCSTRDLDHTILVECPLSDQCTIFESNISSVWPQDKNQIVHMISTRAGDRLLVRTKPNINYKQNAEQSLMNINNSLIVDTKLIRHSISGFGVAIDPQLLIPSENIDRKYRAILRDIFSDSRYGLQLNFLVLRLEQSYVARQNIAFVLEEVDKLIAESVVRSEIGLKIKTIFNIEGLSKTPDIVATIKGIWDAINASKHLDCWAITIDKDWVFTNPDSKVFLEDIRNLFSMKNLLSVTSIKETGSFIDRVSKESNSFNGLLVKSDFSSPYNILEYARNSSEKFVIMTLGSTKPYNGELGDWNNAKNLATEILNHLGHGSNGFVEHILMKNILTDSKDSDSLMYEVPGGYFRGPMFYTMGHFSLHVLPGSSFLKTRVETSPNMFGAKYSAFLTPKKDHVVAVVINDNPHLLPFNLIVNDVVVSQIDIGPKSINTIVTKL